MLRKTASRKETSQQTVADPEISSPSAVEENETTESDWSHLEDVWVCASYLTHFCDPLASRNLKKTTFWKRVMAHYTDMRTAYEADILDENGVAISMQPRSVAELENRWDYINEHVTRFSNGYIRSKRHPRGDDETYCRERGSEEYLWRQESEDKKPFALWHCWHILKNYPLWMDPLTCDPRRPRNISASEAALDDRHESDAVQEVIDSMSTPFPVVGRKKAREMKKRKREEELMEKEHEKEMKRLKESYDRLRESSLMLEISRYEPYLKDPKLSKILDEYRAKILNEARAADNLGSSSKSKKP